MDRRTLKVTIEMLQGYNNCTARARTSKGLYVRATYLKIDMHVSKRPRTMTDGHALAPQHLLNAWRHHLWGDGND